MIDGVFSWFAKHSGTEAAFWTLVGLIAAPLVTPVAQTFWKMCAIPPQRLNVWILKARLSRWEMKLHDLVQMNKELRRLVFQCFLGVQYLVLGIGIAVLGIAMEVLPLALGARSAMLIRLGLFALLAGYVTVLKAVGITKDVISAVLVPEKTGERLLEKIRHLQAKLQIDPDGDSVQTQ